MKAVLQREELCSKMFALAALHTRMGASQFQSGLPCFCSAVREEGAIHAACFCQTQGQLGLSFVEEEVRDVDQLSALFGDGILNRRMAIAQCVDANTAQQIEIAVAVFVDKVNTLAANEQNRIPLIGCKQQL